MDNVEIHVIVEQMLIVLWNVIVQHAHVKKALKVILIHIVEQLDVVVTQNVIQIRLVLMQIVLVLVLLTIHVEQMLNVTLETIKHNVDASVVIEEIHSNFVELLDAMETMIVQVTKNVSMNNVLILASMKINVHQEQLVHHKIIWQFVAVLQA
jgi:hypothetical protein